MDSLFLLEKEENASGDIPEALECYFHGEKHNRLGFGSNPKFWEEFIQGLWIYDRKMQAILLPTGNNSEMLKRVRINMRPYAIGFLNPNQYLRDELQSLVKTRSSEKENQLRKRYKLELVKTQKSNFYTFFNQKELDLSFLKVQTKNFDESQIWRFSDRGEYCTLLTKKKENFVIKLKKLLEHYNIKLITCSRIEDIPVW